MIVTDLREMSGFGARHIGRRRALSYADFGLTIRGVKGGAPDALDAKSTETTTTGVDPGTTSTDPNVGSTSPTTGVDMTPVTQAEVDANTKALKDADAELKPLRAEYDAKKKDYLYWHDFLYPKFSGKNAWDFKPEDWHEYGRQVMEALIARYGPMNKWNVYGGAEFPLGEWTDAFKNELLNFVSVSDAWYEAEPRLTSAIEQVNKAIKKLTDRQSFIAAVLASNKDLLTQQAIAAQAAKNAVDAKAAADKREKEAAQKIVEAETAKADALGKIAASAKSAKDAQDALAAQAVASQNALDAQIAADAAAQSQALNEAESKRLSEVTQVRGSMALQATELGAKITAALKSATEAEGTVSTEKKIIYGLGAVAVAAIGYAFLKSRK